MGRKRTIPTRVGRTTWGNALRISIPDHPHAGGENRSSWASSKPSRGPSPRGWGEHMLWQRGRDLIRTIPTRVGRTVWPASYHNTLTDHPHAGGENIVKDGVNEDWGGPSPRGWGEHRLSVRGQATGRTIPTRVGRTAAKELGWQEVTDHPHAGGENEAAELLKLADSGPSPRGWGEPTRRSGSRPRGRTIPTRVGRTFVPP